MDGFHIDEGSLDAMAARLASCANTAPAASAYAKKHVDLSSFTIGADIGIPLVMLAAEAGRVFDQISATLARLEIITAASSREMTHTRATYHAADDATDRALRAVATQRPEMRAAAGQGSPGGPVVAGAGPDPGFASPAAKLVEPTTTDALSGPVQNLLNAPDLLSLSSYALEFLDKVVGIKPLEAAIKYIVGDWEAVSKAGSACKHLAEYCTAYSGQLLDGTTTLAKGWRGAAADAAQGYFAGLRSGIADVAGGLNTLGDEFQTAASGMSMITDTISNIIKSILDKAILAGISAAAGTVTSETGVGLVVGWGAAFLLIAQATEEWREIVQAMSAMVTKAEGLAGLVGLTLGQLKSLDATKIPGDYAGVELPSAPLHMVGAL